MMLFLFSLFFHGSLLPCRRTGVNLSWLGLDGAGPSGFNRVQMLMRQLDVGETYAQSTLDDAAWSLFPPNPSHIGTSRSAIPPASTRYPGGTGGLHVRSTSNAANNLENIIAMAETVREVLPHVPDEVIFQVQFQFNVMMLNFFKIEMKFSSCSLRLTIYHDWSAIIFSVEINLSRNLLSL